MQKTPLHISSAEECADRIVDTIGNRVVLGLPLGLGKPCQIANALYKKAQADPNIRLTILTALHIERAKPSSNLEKRFLEPILERIFGDYPGFDYLSDVRGNTLPPNVEVAEFYLSPGKYLRNAVAQQNYISCNYTHAARDLAALGVNVMAQIVCEKELNGKPMYSLSCNPDLTLDLLRIMKGRAGRGTSRSSSHRSTTSCRSCTTMRWSTPANSTWSWKIRLTSSLCRRLPPRPSALPIT